MRPALLALLAVVAFAANSLTARAALADPANDPFAYALLRLFAGTIILAAFLKSRPTWRDAPGSAALCVYMFGFAGAYTAINTATGALILFCAVQITILGVSAARGEPIHRLSALGCAIALGGLVLLLYNSLSSAPLLPVLAMLVAGAAWGIYTLLGRGGDAPVQQTGRQFVLASVLSLPVLVLVDFPDTAYALNLQGVLLALVSGAVFSGLGYAIWYAAAPRLPAATVASVQLLTPAVAAAMGAIALDETVSPSFALASIVILGGIALTLKKPQPKAPKGATNAL